MCLLLSSIPSFTFLVLAEWCQWIQVFFQNIKIPVFSVFTRQFMWITQLWPCVTVDINICNWLFCVLWGVYNLAQGIVLLWCLFQWTICTFLCASGSRLHLRTSIWIVSSGKYKSVWVKRAWMRSLKTELCWKCSCSCSLGNICGAGRGNSCISLHTAIHLSKQR